MKPSDRIAELQAPIYALALEKARAGAESLLFRKLSDDEWREYLASPKGMIAREGLQGHSLTVAVVAYLDEQHEAKGAAGNGA